MGLEHWNWKGGITHIRAWIRKLYEYRQWVYAVFERDNYTWLSSEIFKDGHRRLFLAFS